MGNIDLGFNVDVLSLNDTALISSGVFNPQVSGFEAPSGSIFLYKNGTSGDIFIKVGPLDTNWASATINQSIAVSGDATGAGTNSIALTLANTGVVAGSYPKVVVDSKGRVVDGITQISNADISSVDWSKLTNVPSQIDDLTIGLYVEMMSMAIPNGVATLDPSAKLSPEQIPNINWSFITNEPTTLAGYGITDAQSTLVSGTNIKTINGNTILGTGDLVVSASAAGPTNSIQYNSAGVFAGQGNLIYDPATNRVTVSGTTALQTRMTLLSGTNVDATQLNKSALYIQIDGDTTVEGMRTYFKRSTAGFSGWITYHYDQAAPNIRVTDEDDDPTYISFRSIGNGSYDNPQYVSSFGARGPQAGVATGFSWWNRSSAESGTELMALDSNFLRLPKGTTAQRPTTVESGMIRFNTTTGKTEEYSGTYWKPAGGMILQVVTGTIGTLSGTTTVPLDNTAPTVTEGFRLFSQSFTPISATSTVVIEFSCTIAQSNNTTTPILSLFSNTTNIGSIAHSGNSARLQNIGVLEQFQPGATTPVTISARIGAQAGSVYVNTGPAQTLGGALSSIYRIYEVE